MMSLNYSAEEFLNIMTTLDFEKFEDGCDLIGPIRIIRHFGWFKGNYFLNLMESFIEQKARDGQKPGNGSRDVPLGPRAPSPASVGAGGESE